jgi:hypothetical protein
MLRPLYVQPLVVPIGELAYMADLLDLHLNNLPVSPEELKPYEPWAKQDIARFFSDFPELEKYGPVLSFSKTKARRPISVSLALNADDAWKTTALSRFSVRPIAGISVSGSLGHGDTAVLWKRRTAAVEVPNMVSVQAGNFSAPLDGSLFYGYFPKDIRGQSTVANWIHGQSRTWNGLFIQSERWRAVQVSLLYHERPTEKIAGVFCEAVPAGRVHVTTGVSRLTTDTSGREAPETEYYVHCGVAGRVAGFGFRVNTGAGQRHPCALPLSAEISRKAEHGELTVLFARIPASAGLARSKIAVDCGNELDLNDSAGADMTLADCRTAFRFSNAFRTAVDVSCVTSGQRDALTASASASGSGVVDYRAAYSYHMSTAATVESHSAVVSLERGVVRWLSTGMSCMYYMASAGYQSASIRVPLDFYLPNGLAVRPYASMFASTSGGKSWSVGLRQSINLFERTWCVADIETSLDENKKQVWDFNASAYFSF